jgi:predicted translin family RNA/ssDNA-binding protein
MPREAMTPTQRVFAAFNDTLTARQDTRERLIKLSRDTTVASKRAIFVLQRLTSTAQADILDEAEERIAEIHDLFAQIARELRAQPPHLFAQAYSPGVQEYVEAATFLHFCRTFTLLSLEELNSRLVFPAEPSAAQEEGELRDATMADVDVAAPAAAESAEPVPAAETVRFVVSPRDYMLGIADLTGECMRMCINALGDRDEQRPFRVCSFVRHIFEGFKILGPHALDRDLGRKLEVLETSLHKIEDACYTLVVRGEEIPKDRLADSLFLAEPDAEGGD